IIQVETVKARRLFAAAPGPGPAALPLVVAVRGGEGTDRDPYPQPVKALGRPPLHKANDIRPAAGHAKQAVGRIPQNKDRLARLVVEAPGPAGGGPQEASALARRDLKFPFPG